MEILKLWKIVLRWKKLFIAILAVMVLVPFIGSFLVKPVYKCRSKIWVKYRALTPQFVTSTFPSDFGKFSYGSSDYISDTFVELIGSRLVIDKVVKDLDLKDKRGNPVDISAIVNPGFVKKALTLKTGIEAVQIEDSDLYEIKAYSTDPEKAAAIANKVTEEFLQLFTRLNKSDLAGSRTVLESEIDRVRGEWNEAEQERMDFRVKTLSIDLDKQKTDLISEMTSLKDQLNSLDLTLESDKAAIASIEASMKKETNEKSPGNNIEYLTDVTTYKKKLYDLELGLAEQLTQFTEAHPAVGTLKTEIEYTKNAIKSTLAKSMTAQDIVHTSYFDTLVQKYGDAIINITTVAAKKKALTLQMKRLEDDQRNVIAKEHQYSKIAQKTDNLKNVLTTLLQQLEYTKIADSIKAANAAVVERAEVPLQAYLSNYKYFPNRKLILFVSLFLGTLFGLAVVFFLDYIDDSFKTKKEVEEVLNVPVLVSVPEKTKTAVFRGNGGNE